MLGRHSHRDRMMSDNSLPCSQLFVPPTGGACHCNEECGIAPAGPGSKRNDSAAPRHHGALRAADYLERLLPSRFPPCCSGCWRCVPGLRQFLQIHRSAATDGMWSLHTGSFLISLLAQVECNKLHVVFWRHLVLWKSVACAALRRAAGKLQVGIRWQRLWLQALFGGSGSGSVAWLGGKTSEDDALMFKASSTHTSTRQIVRRFLKLFLTSVGQCCARTCTGHGSVFFPSGSSRNPRTCRTQRQERSDRTAWRTWATGNFGHATDGRDAYAICISLSNDEPLHEPYDESHGCHEPFYGGPAWCGKPTDTSPSSGSCSSSRRGRVCRLFKVSFARAMFRSPQRLNWRLPYHPRLLWSRCLEHQHLCIFLLTRGSVLKIIAALSHILLFVPLPLLCCRRK